MGVLGERLKLLRKEKGLSLDELGAALNMPKSSLSRYETGTSDPSIETVRKIARYFNVSIDWLAGETDVRDPVNVSEEHLKKLLKIIDILKEE